MSNVEGSVGFGGCKGLQPSKVRNGLRSFGPGIWRASGLYQPAIARAVKIKSPGLDCASVMKARSGFGVWGSEFGAAFAVKSGDVT